MTEEQREIRHKKRVIDSADIHTRTLGPVVSHLSRRHLNLDPSHRRGYSGTARSLNIRL